MDPIGKIIDHSIELGIRGNFKIASVQIWVKLHEILPIRQFYSFINPQILANWCSRESLTILLQNEY